MAQERNLQANRRSNRTRFTVWGHALSWQMTRPPGRSRTGRVETPTIMIEAELPAKRSVEGGSAVGSPAQPRVLVRRAESSVKRIHRAGGPRLPRLVPSLHLLARCELQLLEQPAALSDT